MTGAVAGARSTSQHRLRVQQQYNADEDALRARSVAARDRLSGAGALHGAVSALAVREIVPLAIDISIGASLVDAVSLAPDLPYAVVPFFVTLAYGQLIRVRRGYGWNHARWLAATFGASASGCVLGSVSWIALPLVPTLVLGAMLGILAVAVVGR